MNGLASLNDRFGVQIAEWSGHDEMTHPKRVDAHKPATGGIGRYRVVREDERAEMAG